ncbi:MAG TPA: glycogen debranching N-terminal domain-containing protein [Pilimelia sp.]|nr:glycogen debranching N-terminal domain-containing protein [Pilimelia sp.]
MRPRQVRILCGKTFMVSDLAGDVRPQLRVPSGLFHRDMRHLSRWELRVDGRRPEAVSGATVDTDQAVFFLAEPVEAMDETPTYAVVRRRQVAGGVLERLQLTNHELEPLAVQVSVLFEADFADVFEIDEDAPKAGRRYARVDGDRVVLGYERGDFRRETLIRAPGAAVTRRLLTYHLRLGPAETWETEIEISVGAGEQWLGPVRQPSGSRNVAQEWLAHLPDLDCADDTLRRIYQQSLTDLAALRLHPDDDEGVAPLPAAGLPWFMALFGRDALITAYQALPIAPDMCRATLRTLADHQATELDDFRDAEPGKILHELRHGELTHFRQQPHSPYYGTADATPLFLVVLEEYERWTGDRDTVRALEGAARAALAWIEHHGDRDGDLFIEYQTRNPRSGLQNHCWKDSHNSIVHPDGTLAVLPRATCEIQGYAYDARRRTARLARDCWNDPVLAERLERDAEVLRSRFVEAFWLPDEGFYALALDGHKQPVRTLTSNIGHLLWSGIVPDAHVDAVVEHLFGAPLFSGWGVRTLAADQLAYNPMGYHHGTVWPHDNSLVTAGLLRYGRTAEAARLAEAMLAAAAHLDHRLPEAIVGAERQVTGVPVVFPTACSPQAWACATPLLLLRALLPIEPPRCGARSSLVARREPARHEPPLACPAPVPGG